MFELIARIIVIIVLFFISLFATGTSSTVDRNARYGNASDVSRDTRLHRHRRFLTRHDAYDAIINNDHQSLCMRYSDIPAQLVYIPAGDCVFAPKPIAHVSQFLSELQFLSECEPTPDQYIVCISGIDNSILRSLYPRARFIVTKSDDDDNSHKHYSLAKYDGAQEIANAIFSDNESSSAVHVIDEPFTDDIARAIGTYSRDNVLLIVNLDSSTDNELVYNNARQHIWAHYIKPRACMLKFSVPSSFDQDAERDDEYAQTFSQYKTLFNIDILQDDKYHYLRADHINLQAFVDATSKYAQLIVATQFNSTNIETYDYTEWESKMTYYNAMRECAFFEKKNDGMFDSCHDCAMMSRILHMHAHIQYADILRRLDIREHRMRNLITPYKSTKQVIDDQRYRENKIIEGGIDRKMIQTFREAFDYIKSNQHRDPYVRVDEIECTMPYHATKFDRRSLHYGQLKLFLAAMQFLNETKEIIANISAVNHDNIIWFIYAGSAPGNVHNILAKCWPNVRFILVDPMSHDIYDDPKRLYYRYNVLEQGLNKNRSPNPIIHVAHPNNTIEVDHKRCTPIEGPIVSADDIVRMIFKHPEYTFHIIEDLFTDDIANAFGKYALSKNTLFMSDIRTSFAGGIQNAEFDDEKSPSDFDILTNNAQQHMWTLSINPIACMLKFRTPYMNKLDKEMIQKHRKSRIFVNIIKQYRALFGVNLYDDYINNRYMHMRASYINVQAFVGGSSTESRFVALRQNGDYNAISSFDPKEWEDIFTFFNIVRDYGYYHHNYLNRSLGIDGCHDCALMMSILEQYCVLHDKPTSVATSIVREHMDLLHRYLIREHHGQQFNE